MVEWLRGNVKMSGTRGTNVFFSTFCSLVCCFIFFSFLNKVRLMPTKVAMKRTVTGLISIVSEIGLTITVFQLYNGVGCGRIARRDAGVIFYHYHFMVLTNLES